MTATKETVISDKVVLPFTPQPFCAAIKCNGMVYCSGILGINTKTLKMVEGPIEERVVCSPTRAPSIVESDISI